MAKSLQKYVKFSTNELETYAETPSSCVLKVNTDLHFALLPHCLMDFKHALVAHIVRRKVGYYDVQLNGIVLAVKNIKVLSSLGAIRSDDPHIHVDINADCFLFRPERGAILSGVVKHIGNHQVGVIIYRVFNVNIRLEEKLERGEVELEQELKFRIKNFDMQNVFPYIEGELLMDSKMERLEGEQPDSMADSGIEERELHEHVTHIKEEPISESEASPQKKKGNKKNRKKDMEIGTNVEEVIVKTEKTNSPKKAKKLKLSEPNSEEVIVKKEKSKNTKKAKKELKLEDAPSVYIKEEVLSESENDESSEKNQKAKKRKSKVSDESEGTTPVKKIKSESAKKSSKKRKST